MSNSLNLGRVLHFNFGQLLIVGVLHSCHSWLSVTTGHVICQLLSYLAKYEWHTESDIYIIYTWNCDYRLGLLVACIEYKGSEQMEHLKYR